MNVMTKNTETQLSTSFDDNILELLSLTRMNAVIEQLADACMRRSQESIKARSPEANPETLSETLTVFESEFRKEIPSLSNVVVDLYRSTFSASELREFLRFFQSELGAQFLTGSRSIEHKLVEKGQEWSSKASRTAFQRAVEIVEKD